MFHQALGRRSSASVAASAAAAAGLHEPEAEHPPLQQQQQQRIVAPLLCATCHKHRTVCIAGGEGAPLSAAEAESEAALASTDAAATDTDSSATAAAGAATAGGSTASVQQPVRQANGQPNKQLYTMLEDALRQANSTELHWGFSFGGRGSAAPADSAFAAAAAAAAADSEHSAQSAAAAAVDVPVAPVPFFPGAFGSLPEAYVGRGRWFAKRVPRGGLLITFLPAFADWCELSSSSSSEEALHCAAHVQDDSDVAQIEDEELEGRQRQRSNSMPAQDMQPQQQQQQQHAAARSSASARSSIAAAAAASSTDDRTTSSSSSSTTTTGCASGGVLSQQALHVFAFLVRAADFKPRTQALGELHAVRSILLANLPTQLQQQQRHRDVTAAQQHQQQHRRADSSSGSDQHGDGGQYKQQLLSLHARNFARAAYSALRQGGTLCGQDLTAALSVCSQSATKVDVTLLRRIKLAAQAQQLQLSPGRANTSSDSSSGSSGTGGGSSVAVKLDRCDEDFATTMAEYFRPVPGTDLYIYWTDERAVFSAAAEQEEVAAAQIAAEEEEEDEQVCVYTSYIVCAQYRL
jgi:hypothetical protein